MEEVKQGVEARPFIASSQIDKVLPAFIKAQSVFKVPVKNCELDAGAYKTKYADLASVMDACREGLAANELAITQHVVGSDLFTVILHSSTQYIAGKLPLLGNKGTPQQLGSAMTYARRYGATSLLGIVAENDDDGLGALGRQQQGRQQNQDSRQQPPRNVPRGTNAPALPPAAPKPQGPPCCSVNMQVSKFDEGQWFCTKCKAKIARLKAGKTPETPEEHRQAQIAAVKAAPPVVEEAKQVPPKQPAEFPEETFEPSEEDYRATLAADEAKRTLITEEQRTQLWASARAANWTEDDLRAYVEMQTGQESTKAISRDKFPAILTFVKEHPVPKA